MAANRKIGREYDIDDNVQVILVPTDRAGVTLANDGATEIFWREQDLLTTPDGTAAVLIATPFFMSRLNPGERVWRTDTGIDLQVVCATQVEGTLRIVPGKLEGSLLLEAVVNVGANIGILNKAEEEIDPATEPKQDDNITQTTALNTVSGTAASAAVAAGAVGTISSKLRSISRELGTIDEDTNAIDTAVGAIADAAVVAGATGSLSAKLRSISRELGSIESDTNDISSDTGDLLDNAGTTAQVAVDGDAAGTISQKLRGINKALAGDGPLTEKVPTWVNLEIATAGTALPFAAADTYATYVGVEAKKKGGSNDGIIYIRDSAVSGIATLEQGHPVGVGGTWEYRARPGTKFDLNDLYLDCETTNTDGIVFVYEPA